MTRARSSSVPLSPLQDKKYERLSPNPVVNTSHFLLQTTKVVQINEEGVQNAARYVYGRLQSDSYNPRTWRTHPLHICPPEPYSPSHPQTKIALDWIFLISALNFSFWSEKEGHGDRYGVDWRESWDRHSRKRTHTGYWSLVAALNRALEEGIPITDPAFYVSEDLCPNSVIEHVFRAAPESTESIPLLSNRITIMREVGKILTTEYGGSFQTFLKKFQEARNGQGTALELVRAVTEAFPSFRDEHWYNGQKTFIWKRAQILVAESWAAFYPPSPSSAHPLFPGARGPAIHHLTMFADYRVPQILHHLRILVYPAPLVASLRAYEYLPSGSREELSIRAASIIAVERVRDAIAGLADGDMEGGDGEGVSSVLIDFYLWDLAKRIEEGGETIEGLETAEMLPTHRTRSIWY